MPIVYSNYYDLQQFLQVTLVMRKNLQMPKIWPLYICCWRYVWRNMSDVFYILNISEIFHYDFSHVRDE